MNKIRYPIIDMLRGGAIALMFIFHFSYDLHYFGVINVQFLEDPFWLNFRRLIVSLFLLLVGISLHLSSRNKINWGSWYKRMGLLIAYAILVSFGSWMMFPDTYIYFGILHFIALASILGLLFRHLYWINLFLGVFIILLDANYSTFMFIEPHLQWIGLMPFLPATEDYVPLLPWFGVVLVGMFIGKTVFKERNNKLTTYLTWNSTHAIVRCLCFGGRHSLHIYMIHQPVFIGLLGTIFWLKN